MKNEILYCGFCGKLLNINHTGLEEFKINPHIKNECKYMGNGIWKNP